MSNQVSKLNGKVFGGIRMTWPKVIIFAVIAGAFTALMMIIPGLIKTSFQDIGISFECWILFAVIIMLGCKSPLDSAVKTFAFFLISQPLVYLIQVPFYYDGFGIFMYYGYWFHWTLLTFPMAFFGWFLGKKKWYSLLILSPALCFLAMIGVSYAISAIHSFPNHLLSAIFCFASALWMLFGIFGKAVFRLIGLGVIIVTAAVCALMSTVFLTVDIQTNLSDTPAISENAYVEVEDESIAKVTLEDTENKRVRLSFLRHGSTTMTLTDGDMQYKYQLVMESTQTSRTDCKVWRLTDEPVVKTATLPQAATGDIRLTDERICDAELNGDTITFTFHAYSYTHVIVEDENGETEYSAGLYYDEDKNEVKFDFYKYEDD